MHFNYTFKWIVVLNVMNLDFSKLLNFQGIIMNIYMNKSMWNVILKGHICACYVDVMFMLMCVCTGDPLSYTVKHF